MGSLGIDYYIVDDGDLKKGFGTLMISQFIIYLKEIIDIKEIRVDPNPINTRAIRCYKKVRFRKKELITTPDGLALIMVLDRL
jgi:aminoglycoside 6'-N-acetyltransferase